MSNPTNEPTATEKVQTTLAEAFKSLPPDMRLRSQIDGHILTASEWAEVCLRDESKAMIGDHVSGYGKVIRKTVVFPNVGMGFIEVRDND